MDQSMWCSRARSRTKSTLRSLGAVRGMQLTFFSTLHVFTKEPIRKQEIKLECMNGFQLKLGHRCNVGTLICWWGERSYIKVKGHLRSSCKVDWKCESGLIWKVEFWLEAHLVFWYNFGPFVCSCGQRAYTKVKGHQRSSCKMGSKCKICLIWKVEVGLEPNLVYLYNVGTFTCSWGQRSHIKVKGHVRSIL